MYKLLISRLVQFPLILAVIYLGTFALTWIVPGSPFKGERNMSPGAEAALKKQFHAESAFGFLTYYPYRIATEGNFGPSMFYRGQDVNEIIGKALPVSVQLGLVGMAIALVVGTIVGTLAAVWRGGMLDWLSLTVTLVGISLPSFVLAAALLLVFAFWLGWINVGGGTLGWALAPALILMCMPVLYLVRILPFKVLNVVTAVCAVLLVLFGLDILSADWDHAEKLVLPGLAVSLAPMAYIVRLTRVSMLDVLGADYVRTARAKGCSRPTVVFKHCLRNAFLPVFTYLGPAAAATLTGSFVVEKVFNVPGMGKFFVESVLNRDQTLILGVVMTYSTMLLLFNLVVDFGYTLVDPRIDISGKGA